MKNLILTALASALMAFSASAQGGRPVDRNYNYNNSFSKSSISQNRIPSWVGLDQRHEERTLIYAATAIIVGGGMLASGKPENGFALIGVVSVTALVDKVVTIRKKRSLFPNRKKNKVSKYIKFG